MCIGTKAVLFSSNWRVGLNLRIGVKTENAALPYLRDNSYDNIDNCYNYTQGITLISFSTMVQLGDIFPDFTANTSDGEINFHEWLGESWGILFSHPADFTPVCTTELARVARLAGEFKKRNVKMIALSCDSVESHKKWAHDIKVYGGCTDLSVLPYPIIADENRELCVKFKMIDPDEKDADGLPLPARAVFVIDPKKKMRLSILYPATTGRNFDEILRVIDSLQLTDKYRIATPVDWKSGEPVMVQPSVSDEDVKKMFPLLTVVALPSGLKYIRQTPQP